MDAKIDFVRNGSSSYFILSEYNNFLYYNTGRSQHNMKNRMKSIKSTRFVCFSEHWLHMQNCDTTVDSINRHVFKVHNACTVLLGRR